MPGLSRVYAATSAPVMAAFWTTGSGTVVAPIAGGVGPIVVFDVSIALSLPVIEALKSPPSEDAQGNVSPRVIPSAR